MSEDQDKLAGGFANDEGAGDDVEAHVKATRQASDDAGDEVEAHVKATRQTNDDGDDEVKAHVKQR